MGESKLGFGIPGCGVIGPHHAAVVVALNHEASLVAVADTVPERAQQFAQHYGVTAYHTMQDLLARDDIDVVNICTPSGMHAEHAIAAMEVGKHVVIEKPVAITLPAIDELIAVRRATGRKATVISQHRFDPASRVVHQAVRDRQFGRLTLGNALVRCWRSQAYYDSGAWRGTWAMDGGGVLMNQSIHSVDLLLWMMDPVAEVSAYTALWPTSAWRSKIRRWPSSGSQRGLLRSSKGPRPHIRDSARAWNSLVTVGPQPLTTTASHIFTAPLLASMLPAMEATVKATRRTMCSHARRRTRLQARIPAACRRATATRSTTLSVRSIRSRSRLSPWRKGEGRSSSSSPSTNPFGPGDPCL